MHTIDSERAKYEKMWDQPSYRRNSPGENVAPRAYRLLGIQPGDSVVDYGCGEARATDWLREQGAVVHPVDLVALREDVIEACLWDEDAMAALPVTDYAFCADVMEHIPPGRVGSALRAIRKQTRIGGAFQVASCECKQGERYGETLHLTVRPHEWWQEALERHWSVVDAYETDRDWRHLFIVWP